MYNPLSESDKVGMESEHLELLKNCLILLTFEKQETTICGGKDSYFRIYFSISASYIFHQHLWFWLQASLIQANPANNLYFFSNIKHIGEEENVLKNFLFCSLN